MDFKQGYDMFIIEKQEVQSYKWDNTKMTMMPCEPYYYTPCGSDFTILCNDLKTLRGVNKRYNHWIYRNNYSRKIERVVIYRCNNWLDDTSKLNPVQVIMLNQ